MCFLGSVSGDQSTSQFGQTETSETSCESPQQLMQQPLDEQTNNSDTESATSVLSAACTRTRTVKTPKHYDV